MTSYTPSILSLNQRKRFALLTVMVLTMGLVACTGTTGSVSDEGDSYTSEDSDLDTGPGSSYKDNDSDYNNDLTVSSSSASGSTTSFQAMP